jgi:alpha-D-ribose 1-methylphosphonate 5-triphosphate synthase subunit PhnH
MASRTHALEGGFASQVADSQSAFRIIMDAMAHPASVMSLPDLTQPPAPMFPSSAAVLCTLADGDTPVWLDARAAECAALYEWLIFQTGAPMAHGPAEAGFALVVEPAAMPRLSAFAQGTQDYPDRSTTLILQVSSLEGGRPMTFAGPGIRDTATIAPKSLPADFERQWLENRKRFPCGVDIVFAAPGSIACLPRSSRIAGQED